LTLYLFLSSIKYLSVFHFHILHYGMPRQFCHNFIASSLSSVFQALLLMSSVYCEIFFSHNIFKYCHALSFLFLFPFWDPKDSYSIFNFSQIPIYSFTLILIFSKWFSSLWPVWTFSFIIQFLIFSVKENTDTTNEIIFFRLFDRESIQ
jgi:hypothetical protein